MVRWLDAEEQALWRSFLELDRQLERTVERQLAEFGMSHADYAVLVVLSEATDHQLRVRDLGETIAWESSRLAHHLRRMERRGLVRRGDHPVDRRGTLVFITDAGLQLITSAAPGHAETVRKAFMDRLTRSEIADLTKLFGRIATPDALP